MTPHRVLSIFMETMMRGFAVSTLLALTAMQLGDAAQGQDKIDVRVVKYDGLAETIKQLKGKIVVVDFWAHW